MRLNCKRSIVKNHRNCLHLGLAEADNIARTAFTQPAIEIELNY